MRWYYAREDTVADVDVFPVVEAETKEELPRRVNGCLVDYNTAQMECGGVEDDALREMLRKTSAVVVHEALQLLDRS